MPGTDYGPGPPEPTGPVSPEEFEAAYRQATKAATRASMLGALGFGVALLMFVILAERGPSPSPTPVSLEHMLIFGGVFGGLVFTAIAVRASRTARACREQLGDDHERRP